MRIFILLAILLTNTGCDSIHHAFYSLTDNPQLIYEGTYPGGLNYPMMVFKTKKDLRWPFYESLNPSISAVWCEAFQDEDLQESNRYSLSAMGDKNGYYRYELYVERHFGIEPNGSTPNEKVASNQKKAMEELNRRDKDIECSFYYIDKYNDPFTIPHEEFKNYYQKVIDFYNK